MSGAPRQRRRRVLQREDAELNSLTHEPEHMSPTLPQGNRPASSPQATSSRIQQPGSSPHASPSSAPIPSSDSSHIPVATQARGQDSRVFIMPIGDSFNPPSAVRFLTDSIKQKFDKPCIDWLHAPKDHKDTWFEEFEKRCRWEPSSHAAILRNFKIKGGQRLRGLLADARKDLNKRPQWIGEQAWEAMKAAWKDPSYMKKSKQNSVNRRSDVCGLGPSLYSGGSAPIFEHKRKLGKELNREPSVSEVFLKTHTKKDKSGFVDKRSEKTYQDFLHRKEQLSQSSVGEAGSENICPPPDDMSLWLDTVGGKKKGRIYGLGSEASIVGGGSSQSHEVNSTGIVHSREFQEELQRQVAVLNSEWQDKMAQQMEAHRLQTERDQQEMQRKLSFLMNQLGVTMPSAHPDGPDNDGDQGGINGD